MEYSASRLPSFLQSRVALIAVIAIVLIVIIALVVVLSSGHAKEQDDVSQLPVSGITDTTGTSDSGEEAASVEVAPTSSHVVYSVAKGNECYVETYTDGKQQPEMLTGPAERTVEVTGEWTIATVTPDYLTVTVDGEKVTLTASEEYSGMYAYTVNFPQILEKWRQTHSSRDAQRSAAVAEAGTTSASSSESAATGQNAADQAAAGDSSYTDNTGYTDTTDYGYGTTDYGYGTTDYGYGTTDNGYGATDYGYGTNNYGYGTTDYGYGTTDYGYGTGYGDTTGYTDYGYGTTDTGY